jgi:hypothetical protein
MWGQPPLRQAQGRLSAVRPSESSAGSGRNTGLSGLTLKLSRKTRSDRDLRRSAGGLRCEELRRRSFGMRLCDASLDIARDDRCSRRLRMCPLRCGHRAAAVLVAAAGAADGALIRVRPVALVGCLADTAGVRWRSGSRQCQRNKSSDKREQKQKSGGQALHVLLRESEPQGGASIEQNPENMQAEGGRGRPSHVRPCR